MSLSLSQFFIMMSDSSFQYSIWYLRIKNDSKTSSDSQNSLLSYFYKMLECDKWTNEEIKTLTIN